MKSLVWFTQDLRIHDNPLLAKAHQTSSEILHVFFIHDRLRLDYMPGIHQPSQNRQIFLFQALADLRNQLREKGHDLFVLNSSSRQLLPAIIEKYNIDTVYRSIIHGYDEKMDLELCKKASPQTNFKTISSFTLYTQQQLPFPLDELPNHFTPFRKLIEKNSITNRKRSNTINWSKPIYFEQENIFYSTERLEKKSEEVFIGGETSALKQLNDYFSSKAPSTYKQTRNSLMGFKNTTKLSPWLAQGSLSVVELIHQLKKYEKKHGANESTYWIYFEILWREYFYWNAVLYEKTLFDKKGRRDISPLTTFYPERFNAWINGTTEWPIVNACMKELAATGFMSNRGRQLVASCFVHELAMDWRYGAAYFEQELIDYDVGSNWGNWQYLAGVGADPRGYRKFDLKKQTQIYDPDEKFITYWQGNKNQFSINQRDAADWPIEI